MIEAKTVMQALGDVLFTGDRVYPISDPDREVLIVKKINWEKQTNIVQDTSGRLLEIDWDSLEFYDPVEFNLVPDQESSDGRPG